MCWRLGGLTSLNGISPHRPRDVLQLLVAEIGKVRRYLVAHLAIGVFGQADSTGLGDPLQSRRDIDAVTHQIAVRLNNHVAKMDADPEVDPPVFTELGIALGHALLHLDGAAHRIHHARKLDQNAVASRLDDAAPIACDGGIDQLGTQRAEAGDGAVLVRANKAAVSDHIRRQYRRKFPGLGP